MDETLAELKIRLTKGIKAGDTVYRIGRNAYYVPVMNAHKVTHVSVQVYPHQTGYIHCENGDKTNATSVYTNEQDAGQALEACRRHWLNHVAKLREEIQWELDKAAY